MREHCVRVPADCFLTCRELGQPVVYADADTDDLAIDAQAAADRIQLITCSTHKRDVCT